MLVDYLAGGNAGKRVSLPYLLAQNAIRNGFAVPVENTDVAPHAVAEQPSESEKTKGAPTRKRKRKR